MARKLIAGRYRLLEPLGGGSMGSVWLAEDTELGRRVAVKLLGPDADRARFDREARAAASLAHPNLVQLYDYGEEDGRPYMVLEHLAGGSLDDRIRRGTPLPDEETERIAREVAAGLAHAHARGLVHRDLKPANILFDAEGRAKIADFGIARMGGTGTLTEAGTVLGTAAYISPEQARGEVATPASDVYSFGVVLFLMLTGRLPFEAAGAMELAAMHRDREPPPVSAFRAAAPPALVAVADAALLKDPAARPADGAALADMLGLEPTQPPLPLTGEPTMVLPRARPAPARRPIPVLPLAIAGAAVLLVAGAGLAFLATGSGSDGSSTSFTLSNITPPTSAETRTQSTTHASTAATTSERTTTTAPTTTAPTTTSAPTTTASPTTTAAPTTAPTTTAPTTTAATTEPVTTDTLPTDTLSTTATVPVP